jgi:hypothetical protein
MVLLAGYMGISRPVGNGIVLGGVKNALVERCEAYGNGGWNTNPGGGPVGCAIIMLSLLKDVLGISML